MSPLRRLVLLCALIVSIVLLDIHLPSRFPSADSDSDARPVRDRLDRPEGPDRSGGFRALFSFHTPLFAPSAIISLANDNSTFFLARPAAFGPFLPSAGLTGQLWIAPGLFDGRRLIYDGHGRAVAAGELGCGDVPDWEKLGEERERDVGSRRGMADVSPKTGRGETLVQSNPQHDRESDEMVGKVVLVSRGGCSFLDKTMWAQRRGAVAIVVGDNIPGSPLVTMYANDDTSNVSIPAIFTSYTTARLLSSLAPDTSPTRVVPNGVVRGQHSKTQGLPPRGKISRIVRSLWTRGAECISASCTQPGAARPFANANHSLPDAPISGSETRLTSMSPYSLSRDDKIHSSQRNLKLGVWVTLTPTSLSASPFLDTLLVLVVSPLVTLTIVYGLLILRHRIRRRQWLAPKRVVQRLPVRVYREPRPSRARDHTRGPTFEAPTDSPADEQTPLLSPVRPHSDHRSSGITDPQSSSSAGRVPPTLGAHDEAALEDASSGKDEPNATGPTTPEVGTPSPPSGRARWIRALQQALPWARRQSNAGHGTYYPRSILEAPDESEGSPRLPQTTCAVCCDEYVHGVSLVMTLPCGHEFHQECITEWLVTRRGICPVCRHDVVQGFRQGSDHRRSSVEHA